MTWSRSAGVGPERPFAETDGVEFAVSLGGDGTMLRTVELVLASRVPCWA